MFWKSTLISFLVVFLIRLIIIREHHSVEVPSMSSNIVSTMHEAPLLYNEKPEMIIPHSYIVRLAPGHSLEQHVATINLDTATSVDHVCSFIKAQVFYIVRPVDEALLSAIRSDPKVEDVQCESDIILF